MAMKTENSKCSFTYRGRNGIFLQRARYVFRLSPHVFGAVKQRLLTFLPQRNVVTDVVTSILKGVMKLLSSGCNTDIVQEGIQPYYPDPLNSKICGDTPAHRGLERMRLVQSGGRVMRSNAMRLIGRHLMSLVSFVPVNCVFENLQDGQEKQESEWRNLHLNALDNVREKRSESPDTGILPPVVHPQTRSGRSSR
eukprot:gb/GECG01000842.1/.p1 GENE.gb/GECG01000842.1/~~gb/GECG01000842.1/.p1  ORF type:complete len:195 (+),score=14.38 gb/GECG01000842.1/:1-585(+)